MNKPTTHQKTLGFLKELHSKFEGKGITPSQLKEALDKAKINRALPTMLRKVGCLTSKGRGELNFFKKIPTARMVDEILALACGKKEGNSGVREEKRGKQPTTSSSFIHSLTDSQAIAHLKAKGYEIYAVETKRTKL